jgi:hypothetical protein
VGYLSKNAFFGHELSKSGDQDSPGFLRYLVLTCAVVASADSSPDTHDFGKNLQRLFGTRRSFGQRSGLPGMWAALTQWCNDRHARGEPIRKVQLPNRGTGIHIGLTNAVSFPSWRDVLRLRSEFEHRTGLAASIRAPQDAARSICHLVRQEADYGEQMVESAREFHRLYQSQASLLHLHRFWAVVCRAARLRRFRERTKSTTLRIELVFSGCLTDTELRLAFLGSDGVEQDAPFAAFTDRLESALTHLREWNDPSAQRWLSTFSSGAVAFVQEGFGVWVASDSEPDESEPFLYLVRSRRLHSLPQQISRKAKLITPIWALVGPVAPLQAAAVHQTLGVNVRSRVSPETPVRVEHGVKTKAGWLGRQRTLPCLIRSGNGQLSLLPAKDASSAANLVQVDRNRFQVGGVNPLDGLYRLKLEESVGEAGVLAIETGIRFTADAPEHSKLSQPSGRWRPQPECVEAAWEAQTRSAALTPCDAIDHGPKCETGFDDLLEIIYALGRGGWSESELIAAVRDLMPGPSPWDVIRGLYESGWLERRVHETWRATSWWLVPSHLLTVPTPSGVIGILGGSAPAVVRRRFEETARTLGGAVAYRRGVGPASPDTLIVIGVSLEKLAAELEWRLMPATVAARLIAPRCWPANDFTTDQHTAVKIWDWPQGRFVEGPAHVKDRVRLTWWRRDDGDRADLFTVEVHGNRLTTISRTLALADAFRQIGTPMFEQLDGFAVRIPVEGHMPLQFARTFHTTGLRASGPVFRLGRWGYAYASSQPAVDIVSLSLGPRFIRRDSQSFRSLGTGRMAPSVLGLVRHRRDRLGRVVPWPR